MEIKMMSIKPIPPNQSQFLTTKASSSQPKPVQHKKPKQYPPLSKDTLERLEKWEQEEQKQWFRNGMQKAGDAVITPFSNAREAISKWSWFEKTTLR
jgi:hypothetical protein